MFYDKLKNGTRVLVINKMTNNNFIFILTENYKSFNSSTKIHIEYKNGIRKEENSFIRNSTFNPATRGADVYIIAEEYWDGQNGNRFFQ